MEALPIVDRERLSLVSRGNAERAREFFGALVDEAIGIEAELRAIASGAEADELVRERAHSLKGMALEVGAPRLAAAAAALEKESDAVLRTACFDAVARAIAELQGARDTL